MKGLAITNKGIEDVAASEINDLTNAKTTVSKGCVIFETEKIEDFFKICYKGQSINKVLFLLSKFKIKKLQDIEEQIKKINLDEWITKKTTFVVRSASNSKDFRTKEMEPEVGGFIINKTNAKVKLENPGTTFFVLINGKDCYIGIDFSGEDLGKREYRIFTGSDTMKPTVAFSLLKIAEFKPEEVLLDPFCKAGTIPIEAALFASNFPVNYFNKERFLFLKLKKFGKFDFESFFSAEDKEINTKIKTCITAADASFQSITAAKKNANIAGIIKKISFSRKEPKWLDLKFKKKSINKIVSFPPQKSRTISEKKAEKIYDELFYQAEYILNDSGKVVLLLHSSELAEKAAQKHKFNLKEKRKVMQGQEEFNIVVFEK